MNASVTLSRRAAEYLVRLTRAQLECASRDPKRLRSLRGEAFIDRLLEIDRGNADMDELREVAIPVYREACAALDARAEDAGAVTVPVAMSAQQHAAFLDLAKAAEIQARPQELLLALACDRMEIVNDGGEGGDYESKELGAMLWRFAVKGDAPAPNYWGKPKQPAA